MRGVHPTLSKHLLAFPQTYARSSCRGGRSSRRPHGRPRIWRHDVTQRQYREAGRIRVVEWLVAAVRVEIGPAQTGQFDFDDRIVGFLDPARAWEGIGRALLSVAAARQRVVGCSRRGRNALDPDVVGRRVEADGEMGTFAVRLTL
jgi:GNAT superfamily N-acetyltransferase